jgi:hypothetical protein
MWLDWAGCYSRPSRVSKDNSRFANAISCLERIENVMDAITSQRIACHHLSCCSNWSPKLWRARADVILARGTNKGLVRKKENRPGPSTAPFAGGFVGEERRGFHLLKRSYKRLVINCLSRICLTIRIFAAMNVAFLGPFRS